MIGRPSGDLPPEDRAKLRAAGVTLLVSVVLAVVVTVILAGAGVSPAVTTAVGATIAIGTALVLVFRVFKVQRYAADMRRERKAMPRIERVRRHLISLIIGGFMVIALWKVEDEPGFALAGAILLGFGLVWGLIDIVRAPRS